jgi:hypothetical protein
MYKDKGELITMLGSPLQHESRWIKLVPLLIGTIAAVVACLGYAYSRWTFMAIGLFILIVGFSAQAVLWFGLRDLNRH